jgi:hypothetical protein
MRQLIPNRNRDLLKVHRLKGGGIRPEIEHES